jgi:putative chitinase
MPTQDIIRLEPHDLVWALGCTDDLAREWHEPLTGAAVIYEINTPRRIAAWLATLAHESASLTHLQENLNYSAVRLLQVWPNRFGIGKANPVDYAYQPEKLANFVYSNRMGNGDEESGDGWRYIGRGPIQLTGKDNYSRCSAGINTNIVKFPDLLLEPSVGAMSAGWFWASNGLNELADEDRFEDIVRRVNGGLTGYEQRVASLKTAQDAVQRFA